MNKHHLHLPVLIEYSGYQSVIKRNTVIQGMTDQGGLNGKWSGPLPGGVVVDPRLAPLTISGKWVGMGQ